MRTRTKHCNGCGADKPRTTEFFYYNCAASDHLQSRCKPCDNRHRGQARGAGVYDRIARALGVTPTRVKQIEQSAMRKIRRSRLGRSLAAAWGLT